MPTPRRRRRRIINSAVAEHRNRLQQHARRTRVLPVERAGQWRGGRRKHRGPRLAVQQLRDVGGAERDPQLRRERLEAARNVGRLVVALRLRLHRWRRW